MRILLILLFGFCFAQDSTSVEQKLGEVGEMRVEEQMVMLKNLRIDVLNTIISAQKQIELSEEDLSRIEYADFVLKQLLDPPEKRMNETN